MMRVSMKLIGCDFGATMPLRSIYMRLLHFRETRLEDLHILGLQALEGSDKAQHRKMWCVVPNQAQERDAKPSSTLKSVVHISRYSISHIKLEYSSGQVLYQF